MSEPTILLLSTSDTDLITARASGAQYRWANPSRLVDGELSEQLGLSRTPLREAFRLLAADGLLLQLPNRGVQVVSLSREDVCHAFEVMASLEGLAGELAAARVTDADLDDLKALQGDLEKAHRRRDLPAYYRVNRAIHDRLNIIVTKS